IMNLRITTILIFITVLLTITAVAQPKAQATSNVLLAPGDCSWEATPSTTGRGRGPMKTRTAEDGKNYQAYNRGKAIDLAEWFKFTCGLNAFVTAQPAADKPIDGAENITVTLKGYVLAVKFMRGGDHDLHVELGATPDWNGDHVVVEMSPGKAYCKARDNLWKIAEKDGCKSDECILKKPVKVEVRGYLLIGGVPPDTTDYCHVISTRGLRDAAHESRVRGIWRLQPVLMLKKTK
ncbi:MAG: hypothetical protein ABIO36_01250, partial [Pyrinomonadaceae bacterium]